MRRPALPFTFSFNDSVSPKDEVGIPVCRGIPACRVLVRAGFFLALAFVWGPAWTEEAPAESAAEEAVIPDVTLDEVLENSIPAAQISQSDTQTTPGQRVFRLKPTSEAGWSSFQVDLEGKDVVFRKTPDFKGHDVISGALPTGESKEDYTCFAIDVDGPTLYIDQNRNLDLTDDPSGVYRSQDEAGSRFITFNTVSLGLPISDKCKRAYTLFLYLSRFEGQAYVYCQVQSSWRGEIRIGGQAYQVMITDDLDGVIGLEDSLLIPRPQDQGHLVSPITPTSHLFMEGHDYAIDYAFIDSEDSEACDLSVTVSETKPAMGTLTPEGRGIHSLLLQSEDRVALLDQPSTAGVALPSGTYSQQICILKEKDLGYYLTATAFQTLDVPENGVARLGMGAPVQPVLRATRYGRSLNLDYDMLGVGGEKYSPAGGNPPAPEFKVYKSRKEIASGRLEYG